VNMVKKLAREHHSAALAQLASRIVSVMRYGAADGDDVFAKVKDLITDMIAKLEAEAKAEATEKAYCDEEMSKTEAKKSELEGVVSKLTSKIDLAAAKSAELKEEVKVLQGELATLAKQQAESDAIRAEEKAAYDKAKAELELGITGVQKALSVLKDYYGSGAGDSMPLCNSPQNQSCILRQVVLAEALLTSWKLSSPISRKTWRQRKLKRKMLLLCTRRRLRTISLPPP